MHKGTGSDNGGGTPSPSPVVRLEVQQAEENGRPILQLFEAGPTSQHITRMSPDVAIEIGQMLSTHGRRLKSGLVLPPPH